MYVRTSRRTGVHVPWPLMIVVAPLWLSFAVLYLLCWPIIAIVRASGGSRRRGQSTAYAYASARVYYAPLRYDHPDPPTMPIPGLPVSKWEYRLRRATGQLR